MKQSLRDLAILYPMWDVIDKNQNLKLKEGYKLNSSMKTELGREVYTFGFPLGYNGPSPVLTKGYISGFNETAKKVRHLILNAGINPGNSGGALIDMESKNVIGVIVSKHAPIPEFYMYLMKELSKQDVGLQYQFTDGFGNKLLMTDAQMIANLLLYFREMTQTVIAEAIDVYELIEFLKENNIKY
jgi:hypothetical protein